VFVNRYAAVCGAPTPSTTTLAKLKLTVTVLAGREPGVDAPASPGGRRTLHASMIPSAA